MLCLACGLPMHAFQQHAAGAQSEAAANRRPRDPAAVLRIRPPNRFHFSCAPAPDNEPLKGAMAAAADLHARIYRSYNLPYDITPGARKSTLF